jgi:DNA repair protein RadA/Sms
MKIKTAFFCQHCGYESAKWAGKCPSCGQWNTFVEEKVQKDIPLRNISWQEEKKENGRSENIVNLSDVSITTEERLLTPDGELNRVLGGGIVPGSLVLVGGEPGIGKSTLFLQNALQLKNITTLYISGEESAQQIKMRADRLQITNDQFYLLTETSTETIFKEIKKLRPRHYSLL